MKHRFLRSALGIVMLCLVPVLTHAQAGPGVDELAREVATPGAAKATLNFKTDYRTFDGSVPGASDANSLTFTFQPDFPFKLQNGNNLTFRPAFSYIWGARRPSAGAITEINDWNDIPFDLLYSWQPGAWTLGAGAAGNIPVGSGTSSDNWLLGPSLLAVRTFEWGVARLFPFHNKKVGGNRADTSITSLQYFLFYGLGDGWQIGTGPAMSYDWKAPSDQAVTIPLQIAVAKTEAIGNRIVKLNFPVEKNVVKPDSFSEDRTFTSTFGPVVKNPLQPNPPSPPLDEVTRSALLTPIR